MIEIKTYYSNRHMMFAIIILQIHKIVQMESFILFYRIIENILILKSNDYCLLNANKFYLDIQVIFKNTKILIVVITNNLMKNYYLYIAI